MRFPWLVSTLVFLACSGEDSHPKTLPPAGTGGGTVIPTAGSSGTAGTKGGNTSGGGGGTTNLGGNAGEAGESGSAGAPETSAAAPLVAIVSPPAVSDPNTGEVLTGNQVKVRCRVTKSSEPRAADIDASSVRIAVLDSKGRTLTENSGAPLENGEEFETTLTLATFTESSPVRFRCTARDKSETQLVGHDEISTFLDRGPIITVNEPEKDSAQSLQGPVSFDFTVDPSPLTPDDLGAAVSKVTLQVGDVLIDELTTLPNRPNHYSAAVDFRDPARFGESPTGQTWVLIRARNSRSPEPTENTDNYPFNLDGTGPTIEVVSPPPNAMVGRRLTLQFSVKDDLAGVDPGSIVVKINEDSYEYDPTAKGIWGVKDDTYTFVFDRSKAVASRAQVTVQIIARDLAGNETRGESVPFYLDDVPPFVSMDPRNLRLVTKKDTTTYACSDPFDPLGAAASDGDRVLDSVLFRALVWDRTNGAPGQSVYRYASVNQSKVVLYLQPDASKDLLVDNDDDGYCDDFAEGLVPLRLDPVPPQGTAPHVSLDTLAAPAAPITFCALTQEQPPRRLCTAEASDLSIAIGHELVSTPKEPVIYGYTVTDGLECTGANWEFAPAVKGKTWVCLGVRAEDKLGNVGVSRPLRVCYDKSGNLDPNASSPCDGTPPPACHTCEIAPLQGISSPSQDDAWNPDLHEWFVYQLQ